MVAIFLGGKRPPATTLFSDDPSLKCRMKASKLTIDAVQWLMSIIEYEKRCDAKNEQCQSGP